jgi:hypothetical protein
MPHGIQEERAFEAIPCLPSALQGMLIAVKRRPRPILDAPIFVKPRFTARGSTRAKRWHGK